MRTYSRARGLADQLTAERLSSVPQTQRSPLGLQGRLLAEARVPRRSALEQSVSTSFEMLRQQLGNQAEADGLEPVEAAAAEAAEPAGALDDAIEVPRFVAKAEADAQQSDDDLPPYVTYERPMRLPPVRSQGPRWPAVAALLAIIVPAASGFTILAFAGEEAALSNRVARIGVSIDAVVAPMLGWEAGTVFAAASSSATDGGAATEVSAVALFEPETGAPLADTDEIAALAARADRVTAQGQEQVTGRLTQTMAVAPGQPEGDGNGSVPSAAASVPDREDYAAADADTLPAMTHALRGAVAEAPLDAASIAWAVPDGDAPMAQPVPRVADVEPAKPVLSVARVGVPQVLPPTRSALGASNVPVNGAAEPIISRVVGSLRSTSAQQTAPARRPLPMIRAVPRIRPKLRAATTQAVTPRMVRPSLPVVRAPVVRPNETKQTLKAAPRLRPRPKLRLPAPASVPPAATAPKVIERSAIVGTKRPKPRPLPQSSSGFLGKQAAAKLAAARDGVRQPLTRIYAKPTVTKPTRAAATTVSTSVPLAPRRALQTNNAARNPINRVVATAKPLPKAAGFRAAAAVKPAPAKPIQKSIGAKVLSPAPRGAANKLGAAKPLAAKAKLPPPSWTTNMLTR